MIRATQLKRQFRDMVDDLSSNPLIRVKRANRGSPVNRRALEQAVRRMGKALPSPLTRLYMAMNGLELQWSIRQREAVRMLGTERHARAESLLGRSIDRRTLIDLI